MTYDYNNLEYSFITYINKYNIIHEKFNSSPKLKYHYINRTVNELYDKWLYDLYENPQFNRINYSHRDYYDNLYEFLKLQAPEWIMQEWCKLEYIDEIDDRAARYIAIIINKQFVDVNNVKASDEIESKLKHLANVYRYTENARYIENSRLVITYYPDNLIDISDFVNNTNILYHICPKTIYENKIKKNRLIPKIGKKHNRYYLPIVYIFTYPLSEKEIISYITQFNKSMNEYIQEWVVLKIDLSLNNYKMKFYSDPEYMFTNKACYTYETMHPRCISLYKEITI